MTNQKSLVIPIFQAVYQCGMLIKYQALLIILSSPLLSKVEEVLWMFFFPFLKFVTKIFLIYLRVAMFDNSFVNVV